ncbi:MAG: hypothetical protein ABI889_02095 [Gemmatimonadota bacterium]
MSNSHHSPRGVPDREPFRGVGSFSGKLSRSQRRQAFKVTLDLSRVRRLTSVGGSARPLFRKELP